MPAANTNLKLAWKGNVSNNIYHVDLNKILAEIIREGKNTVIKAEVLIVDKTEGKEHR